MGRDHYCSGNPYPEEEFFGEATTKDLLMVTPILILLLPVLIPIYLTAFAIAIAFTTHEEL